jgi:HEAT repeat protein
MRRASGGLTAFAAVFLVAVAALVEDQAGGQPPSKSKPPTPLNEVMQAGRQAAIDSERAGETLLANLNDATLPGKDRSACALALGKLRYTPAIPRLIELITLEGPKDDPLARLQVDAELPPLPASILEIYPCAQALVGYGELALPQVTKAYLKESNLGIQQALLAAVLLHGNTKSNRVYLQGLLMENPSFRCRMKLLELLPKLQEKNKVND